MQKKIVQAITDMLADDEFGFEVYIVMKSQENRIKWFSFYEENGESDFRDRLRNSIAETIREKFLSESAEYVMAERVADNQKKLYIIRQTEEYKPLGFLKTLENIEAFSIEERNNAEGILFRFGRGRQCIWAYQHIHWSAIPDIKRCNFIVRAISAEKRDTFVEMPDMLFAITRKVDALIVDDNIVTADINLMQRHFKFDMFIKGSADKAVKKIESIGIVSNTGKLNEYIERSNTRYARKMMRINSYHVINKSSDDLIRSIENSKRWKTVFDIKEGKISLNTYTDVEHLIDLFDERFTISEITGDEFDTDVKKLVD